MCKLHVLHVMRNLMLLVLQICGGYTDSMTRCAQLLEENVDATFVDVNVGCPIDLICNK